jgi:serralysin
MNQKLTTSGKSRRAIVRSVVNTAAFEGLESRQMLAAVDPTAFETYMVELINRARANPAAEATRFNGYVDPNNNRFNGSIDEGLSPGTIANTPRQPLAINWNLNDSARSHAQWLMSSNNFGHTGSGGSQPSQRMTSAGYNFTGSWGASENVGIDGNTSLPNDTRLIEDQHAGLFTDMTVPGRGHRLNLMDGNMREVGSGVAKGNFNFAAYGLNMTLSSVITAQNFARTGTNVYLTGVAYRDTVTANNFYTPGEGIAGVTVSATGTAGTFSTTSWTAGGYSLALPPGTYTVTATGGTLGGTVTYTNVVVGSENVKRDFTPAQAVQNGGNNNNNNGNNSSTLPSYITLVNGALTVNGTSAPDTIAIDLLAAQIRVNYNSTITSVPASSITSMTLNLGEGSNTLNINSSHIGAAINAGSGDDQIFASEFNDQVNSGAGNDFVAARGGDDRVMLGAGNDGVASGSGRNSVYGEDGDDRLGGSNGRDFFFGGNGNDRLYGGGGDDMLDGGSHSDRLWGGDGNDQLLGGRGIDRLFGEAGNDTLNGGADTDLFYGGADIDTIFRDSMDSVWELVEVVN